MCYLMIKILFLPGSTYTLGDVLTEVYNSHCQWYDPVPPSALKTYFVILPLEFTINSKLHLFPSLKPAIAQCLEVHPA